MRRAPLLFILALVVTVLPAARAAESVESPTTSALRGGSYAAARPVDDGDRPVGRLAGPDRVTTAIALSQRGWPGGADTALVATASNFPDALAAGALSAELDAPILLTPSQSLPEALRDELRRLNPERVIMLGGLAAVGGPVEQALRAEGFAVERIAGVDRFDTAARIARRAGAPAGWYSIASGTNFPDALSAGSLSATPDQLPTLLVTRDTIPDATRGALVELGVETDTARAEIVGGTAVVSAGVQASLRGSITRLAGPTRFETSQAVVARALQQHDDSPRPLLVATGQNFPDALAAGSLAAKLNAPLLLVPTGNLTDGLAAFISGQRARFSEAFVIGGAAAVSDHVQTQVHRVLNGLPKDPAPDPGPDPDPDPGCVDLNTASFERLQEIIHIGPGRAQDIIDRRPWGSVDELINLDGIGPARLRDIKDQGLACVL